MRAVIFQIIVAKLAEVKKITVEEVADITTRKCRKNFQNRLITVIFAALKMETCPSG